jgi:hypothetical protein
MRRPEDRHLKKGSDAKTGTGIKNDEKCEDG